MENFTFHNPARILFGDGQEQNVGELLKNYGKRVLFISGGKFVDDLGISSLVKEQSIKHNLTLFTFGNIVPNPRIETVREGVIFCKENDIDVILAAGGGSVMDTAKAIAAGSKYDGDVWDFFTGAAEISDALPVGTIVTIPSSGSEMSNASIISNDLQKLGVEHEALIPKFSILNPAYTLTLPPYHTACGIADTYTHILERYFTDSEHVDLTDFLLEGAMQTVLINGPKVLANPSNYDFRSEIMWTATVAHNNSLETGRIPDWGSHRIEHELSAQYNITHAEGMTIVFPAWMKYASKLKPKKFIQYAVRIFGVDPFTHTDEEIIQIGIDSTIQFFKSLGLKTTLNELNITQHHFSQMALRATKNDTQTCGHLIELTSEDIISVLTIAQNG